jgi:3-oxoadipate:acetyl-CoA acetyltransferase
VVAGENRSQASDVIVNFAPTGMIPTKATTPHVPVSVNEIVEDIHQAVEMGITMVHIHAREEGTGRPTCSAEIYSRIISGVRAFAGDLVVAVSLSGRGIDEFERRAEPLGLDGDLRPDMGSLTLSSLNFNKQASMNAPDTIQDLAAEMLAKGIAPELEAFDSGMVNYAKYLARKRLIRAPYYFNLLLGNIACAQADMLHAGVMVADLPAEALWSLAGIGEAQLPMNSVGVALGGGVRVGLEDNLWYDRARTRLATNFGLLERVHRLVAAHDRTIMSPARLRTLLDLRPGHGAYGRAPGSHTGGASAGSGD